MKRKKEKFWCQGNSVIIPGLFTSLFILGIAIYHIIKDNTYSFYFCILLLFIQSMIVQMYVKRNPCTDHGRNDVNGDETQSE